MTAFILMAALACTSVLPLDGDRQLRRFSPGMQGFEQNEARVNFAKGITRTTAREFMQYMLGNTRGSGLRLFNLYQLPPSTDQYLVSAPDFENSNNTFLLLRKQGKEITEVSRISKVGCPLLEPFFFAGKDRLLLIVSNSAFDGGFCGNYAFEYKDEMLTPLADVNVYDGAHGKGVYQGHSPMDAATAAYRGGKYYLTMRGEGSLYSLDEKDSRLAPRGAPLTFFLDGDAWRPTGNRRSKR